MVAAIHPTTIFDFKSLSTCTVRLLVTFQLLGYENHRDDSSKTFFGKILIWDLTEGNNKIFIMLEHTCQVG